LTVEAKTLGVFSPRIVDNLVDAVIIVEDQGRVLYANPAVERLLGWNVRSLFGEPFTTLVPERKRAGYQAHFADLMAAEPVPKSQAPTRLMMLCADGSELPVDLGVLLVAPEQGPRMLVAAMWDVSDRIDIDRYQRVSAELLTFLAGASGTADDIVPQMLAILAGSMDFEFATAWQWDSEAELLRCEHVWRRDSATCDALMAACTGMTVGAGEGLAGFVARSNEPVWLTDLTQSPHLGRHQAMISDGMRSGFIFPIRTRDRLVGVIEFFTKAHRRPDGPFVDAVADVGAKLGEFIERLDLEAQRAELLGQLERSQRQQDFLLQANRALAEANDFQDAVQRLATVAVPALGDICLIDVVDSNGRLARLAARHADPRYRALTDELGRHAPDISGSHPSALAVRTGRSQWSTDLSDDFLRSTTREDRHYELTRLLNFESYVSVPLLTDGQAIGALTLVTAGSGRRYEEEDLWLSEDLADQVASVIQRARAFDEQSHIAHLLQNSLLPSGLDQIAGIDTAARYVPSSRVAEVGGDFYDVVALADDRVALVIGDVEGHDMSAATVMGNLRSAMRAYLLLTRDPGRVLALLDGYTLAQPTQRLATACLAILDTRTGAVVIASAGHPPPFVVSGPGSATAVAVKPGPPLGVGGGRYPNMRFDLPVTASLALYTDGLIEDGRPGNEHRIERFTTTLNDHSTVDCHTMADAILDTPEDDRVVDDVALLVVKWTGPPEVDSPGAAPH
jgi:PAS domain S-box-containing protein